MINPNRVLSKEMQVKPLREGEVAVYKLCSADEIDYSRQDEETGRFRNKSAGYTLAKKYSVYDKVIGRKVVIGCVKSVTHETLPNKEVREVPVLESLRFELGKTLTVTHNNQDYYEFLERVDSNRDNPFRNPNKKAWFYRVNEKKAAQDKNYKNLILTDALVWIRTVDQTEMKTINKGLPKDKQMNMDSDWDILTAKLFDLTMADPVMVMKASSNMEAKYKIQVMDAEKFQIITYDDGDGKKPRAWYFNRGDCPKIMDLAVGEKKVEKLVEFYSSKDGAGRYKQMVSELVKFLRAGAPDVN